MAFIALVYSTPIIGFLVTKARPMIDLIRVDKGAAD